MIETYYKKLASYYDSEGRLLQYPSKKPMRIIVLIKIAEQIDMDRKIHRERNKRDHQAEYCVYGHRTDSQGNVSIPPDRTAQGRFRVLGGKGLEKHL